MRRTSSRIWIRVLVVLFAAALTPAAVEADTGSDEEFTCPVCEKTYESYVQHSGTCFRRRLDFKELGPIRSPWPIPRCTHCGFVRYQDEWEEAEKAELKAFVASDAYALVWKKHTHYHCLGLIGEALKDWSAQRLAYVFLRASWELDDGDERYPAYAAKAIGHFARIEAPPPDAEDERAGRARADYLVAQYLQLELHRRAGAFDAAKRVLARIRTLDHRDAPEWFEAAVGFEAALVTKGDAAPYTFEDLPPEED